MITLCMLCTPFVDLVLFFHGLKTLPFILLKPVFCVGFEVTF